MFVGYCKQIPVGTTEDGIMFTEQKSVFCNKIVVLEVSLKGSDWYLITGSKLLIHRSWLRYVFNMDNIVSNEDGENKYFFGLFYYNSFVRHSNPSYELCSAVIRIIKYDEDRSKYIDLETGLLFDNIEERHEIRSYLSAYNDIKRQMKYMSYGHTYYGVCSECGISYWKFNNRNPVPNGTSCRACETKNMTICSCCDSMFIKTNKNIINDNGKEKTVCFSCYYTIYDTCDICGSFNHKRNMVKFSERSLCISCYHKQNELNIVSCSDCGNKFELSSDYIVKNKSGVYRCKPCNLIRKLGVSTGSSIRNYSYKPDPIFYNYGKSDHMYFGVELEILTPRNAKEQLSKYILTEVNDIDDFVYNKFDRSIGEEGSAGFEMVTHPFSYTWFKSTDGNRTLKKMLEISKYGCEAYKSDTCGMHIHITKKCFTNEHLYKFLSFIFNNKDFCMLVSERENIQKVDEYSSFIPPISINDMSIIRTTPHESGFRHKAVNISCPNTVEIRIFRSTLEYDRFSKNIEFCKALFEYTKEISFEELSSSSFVKYIIDNKKNYTYLFTFIKRLENDICA